MHLLQGSKHPDAAWEYAAFQAGLESERIMLADRVTVPWHKSTIAAAEWGRTLYPWQSAQVYVETVNKVRPTVYPSQFTEIQKLYTTAYDSVYAGREDDRPGRRGDQGADRRAAQEAVRRRLSSKDTTYATPSPTGIVSVNTPAVVMGRSGSRSRRLGGPARGQRGAQSQETGLHGADGSGPAPGRARRRQRGA